MAVIHKSSLSVGELIRQLLLADDDVRGKVTKVFPVISESEARLPYIVYRRTQLNQDPVKGQSGADTIGIEIHCYTARYTEGIELAEAVRSCLDNLSASNDDGLVMRSCYLVDSSEDWQDDAYIQQLVFNIKM